MASLVCGWIRLVEAPYVPPGTGAGGSSAFDAPPSGAAAAVAPTTGRGEVAPDEFTLLQVRTDKVHTHGKMGHFGCLFQACFRPRLGQPLRPAFAAVRAHTSHAAPCHRSWPRRGSTLTRCLRFSGVAAPPGCTRLLPTHAGGASFWISVLSTPAACSWRTPFVASLTRCGARDWGSSGDRKRPACRPRVRVGFQACCSPHAGARRRGCRCGRVAVVVL
jgi:hypothetical protein